MVVVTHLSSVVLRVLFGILSSGGLLLLVSGKRRGALPHCLVLGGLACEMASGCVVSDDGAQVVASVAVYVCLLLCDIAFLNRAAGCPDLFLAPALLSGVGVSVAFDTATGSAAKHSAFVAVGAIACVVMLGVSRRRSDRIASSFGPLLVLAVLLCSLPLVPGVGISVNGARAWAEVGPVVVQPSELAKVALALSLSGYFAANARRLRELNSRGLLPISVVFALALGLELLVNDLGTGIVIFSLFASMLSLCSRRAGLAYGATLLACVVALVAVAALASPHVAARFSAWRDPYADPQGVGYQRVRAIEAMSNGGLIGTGLRFGPLLGSVPAVESDYAFAAVVEELGVMGGGVVALAVVAIVAVAARAALRLPEGSFERNLAIGGSCLVACQSFMIVGGVTGVIPLTGVTLPFVSLGGSSLLASFSLVGLMGGCSSRSVGSVAGASVAPLLPPVATAVAMAICLASVVGTGGGLRLMGATRRDVSRGRTLTADGVVLAEGGLSGAGGDDRGYPEHGLAAHLLGGPSGGIDRPVCESAVPSGEGSLPNILALPEAAEDTVLTIDSSVQREAEEQLLGATGAIVAMDVSSGDVLALASSPSYDISDGYDPDAGDDVSYLNRATAALYAPGSTFKVITIAAALEGGVASGESVFSGDALKLESGFVTNYGGASYGDMTLTEALEASSNTAFARLALDMGGDGIAEMAGRLGFNGGPCVDGVSALGSLYYPPQDEYALAWSSVGQPVWEDGVLYGPSATVLQMCSVMATIANGGVRMDPSLVLSGPLRRQGGDGVAAMSERTAGALWDMMVASSGATLQGAEVAGKTGTAQSGDGTLCWYICSDGDVAVACCVESDADGLGSSVAKPRALAVLRAPSGQCAKVEP